MIIKTILFFLTISATILPDYKGNEKEIVGNWNLSELTINGKNLVEQKSSIKIEFYIENNTGNFSGRSKINFFSGMYEMKSKKSIYISKPMGTQYEESNVIDDFYKYLPIVNEFVKTENGLELVNPKENLKIKLTKI